MADVEKIAAELREKLEKAVPGPWRYSPWHIEEADPAVRKDGYGIVANTAGSDTAIYITACHPENIRALDRLREALVMIRDEPEVHTKLNQERLCCKFQDIAARALSAQVEERE